MGAREILSSSSGLGQMAGSCEHDNKPSGFIKCDVFLDKLRKY